MTKNIQMIVTVALLISAASCSLFTKDIDVPQEFALRVDLAENNSPQFAVATNVDTGSDEVEKYKDDIDAFNIDKVTFTVSDFAGAGSSALSGELMFATTGSSSFKTLGTVNNANLGSLAASGEEVTVTLATGSAKQHLIDLMQAGDAVTFKLEGSTSSTPLAATLNFKIYAFITVEL